MKAIVNGLIYTMEGEPVSNGTILFEGKEIKAIGKEIAIPAGTEVFDAQGKIVTPGFIDAHTHMGIDEEVHTSVGDDCNEMTDPNTAQVRAYDGINHRDIGFCDAYGAGVTTVMVTPGSANVFGGLVSIMKTAGKTLDDMTIKAEAALKMAFGENPKRVYGKMDKTPATRMATMAIARQGFYDAKTYGAKKEREFDLQKEHILMALERKIPVRAHAHRVDDIMTAIRLRDEFQLDMVIEHCTDGHLIVEELIKANIPVAIGPSLSNRAKVEMEHVSFKTLGILANAGIEVAIITDHPCTPIQYLPICTAIAIREGMQEMDAMKALTITAAKILKIDHQVGSLAVGKDADIVVWEYHPFEIKGKPKWVFINGTEVLSR